MPERVTLPYFLEVHKSLAKAFPRYVYALGRKASRGISSGLVNLYRNQMGNTEQRRIYFRDRVTNATMNAYFRYEASVIKTPILLIRSSENVANPKKNFHLEWSDHTHGEFTTETVDGKHLSILLEPTVSQVADVLQKKIRRDEPNLSG